VNSIIISFITPLINSFFELFIIETSSPLNHAYYIDFLSGYMKLTNGILLPVTAVVTMASALLST
jgi:hypothetical protein